MPTDNIFDDEMMNEMLMNPDLFGWNDEEIRIKVVHNMDDNKNEAKNEE